MAIERNKSGKWRISKTQDYIYDSKKEAQRAVVNNLMDRIWRIKRSIENNIEEINKKEDEGNI